MRPLPKSQRMRPLPECRRMRLPPKLWRQGLLSNRRLLLAGKPGLPPT
jgi:hypothetical protein